MTPGATQVEVRTSQTQQTAAVSGYSVVASSVVFRVVQGELCVGLPLAEDGRRVIPSCVPDARALDAGVEAAARLAATSVVSARELVRLGHAGVRVFAPTASGAHVASQPSMHLVHWSIARPLAQGAGTAQSLEAESHFARLSALPPLDAGARGVLSCAFDAFLDATLADALTRRLLPRHVLFRKTDGFSGRSPFEQAIAHDGGETAAVAAATDGEPEVPLFVGLLPDPFPLSALRELYERLLGAPLDRGNFRRQFHEVISHGPIKALPIFERGVPHRAGQLFTFDRAAWARFAAK